MRCPSPVSRLLVLAALLLGGALAGCVEAPEPPAPPPPPDSGLPGAGVSFTVRGIYHGALYDSAAAAVEHEAVPGFMGAMRMELRVAGPAELRGLREGDKIEFQLVQHEEGRYQMEDVQKLPPETELTLAPSPPDAVPEEDALPDTAEAMNGGL